jgi:hypothetical protein
MNKRGFLVAVAGLASVTALAVSLKVSQPSEGARVSVYPEDHGFDPYSPYIEVRLNGRRLLNCVTADERLGEVECLAWAGLDEWGKPTKQKFKGDVQVIYLPGHPKYHRRLQDFNRPISNEGR